MRKTLNDTMIQPSALLLGFRRGIVDEETRADENDLKQT